MKVLWLNGWGIEATALEERVGGHGLPVWRVVQPFPGWEKEVEPCLSEADAVCAYSTGTLLLLDRPDFLAWSRRTVFFAPILGFLAEWGLGGKTRSGQVDYLRRWLRRDARAALADFHCRVGFPGSASENLAFNCLEELDWGLVQLQKRRVPAERLRGFEAYAGDGDALLDAGRLTELVPGISVVSGAGHDLGSIVEGAGFRL